MSCFRSLSYNLDRCDDPIWLFPTYLFLNVPNGTNQSHEKALGNSKNITIQESTEAVQMQQNPKLLEKQLISLQWFSIDLIGTYLAEFKMHFYFDLHSYIASFLQKIDWFFNGSHLIACYGPTSLDQHLNAYIHLV